MPERPAVPVDQPEIDDREPEIQRIRIPGSALARTFMYVLYADVYQYHPIAQRDILVGRRIVDQHETDHVLSDVDERRLYELWNRHGYPLFEPHRIRWAQWTGEAAFIGIDWATAGEDISALQFVYRASDGKVYAVDDSDDDADDIPDFDDWLRHRR